MILKRKHGFPDNPKPIGHDGTIVRLKCCPDCGGRGWFLINLFATGGPGGCGGPGNATQCETCISAKRYWDEHEELPPELKEAEEAYESKEKT